MLKKMNVAITECQNEMLQKKRKIILTSNGLTTPIGRKLICVELAKESQLHTKRIFLFHEPHYHLEDLFIQACIDIGFTKENIILSGYQKSNSEILSADFIYVTEGNTFEILSLIRQKELDTIIQKACTIKATYIGSSAGAMIAGSSIEEALSFDKNFVGMKNFEGLGLFDGIVIPHYTKKELLRYIRNSPGIEERYQHIYAVSNNGILIFNISQ